MKVVWKQYESSMTPTHSSSGREWVWRGGSILGHLWVKGGMLRKPALVKRTLYGSGSFSKKIKFNNEYSFDQAEIFTDENHEYN